MVDKFEKRDRCLYCDNPMEAKYRNKRFCSDKCRTYWNRENKLDSKIEFAPTTEKSYDGKDVSRVILDEIGLVGNLPKPDNSQRIKELQDELPTVPENTTLGKRRRAWIIQEISRLNRQ